MTDQERPIIGLVGAGGISRSHLPSLLERGARVLVFSEEGADALVRDFREQTTTPLEVVGSFDELLETVDIVDVVTPTYTHYRIARAALEAGRNVICEKPLARTEDEALELVELAEQKGLLLFPAHVVRYFPEYAALKNAVQAGELGDLAVLRFIRSGAFPHSGWFADPELSGGIVLDQMIHDLDQARWIAGKVSTVSAVHTRTTTDGQSIEAAHVILTHASGVISECSGVWGPSHLPFTTEYSAAGTGGTLTHSSAAENGYLAEFVDTEGADGYLPAIDPAEDPYTLELRDYLTAILDGRAARVNARDGVEAVRIAAAALTSATTGQPVDFTQSQSREKTGVAR